MALDHPEYLFYFFGVVILIFIITACWSVHCDPERHWTVYISNHEFTVSRDKNMNEKIKYHSSPV